MTTKALNKRQTRWAEALSPFDFEIQYRKGKENPADGLSRRPDHMVVEENEENPLGDLLRARLQIAGEQHADHMLPVESVKLGVLTRGMARKPRNPEKSELHVLSRPKESLRRNSVMLATLICNTQETAVKELELKIPNSIMNILIHLQAQDEWCIKKNWETIPEGHVHNGPFKGKWCADSANLVRCNGAAYVPQEPTIRKEILRVNHDDPWQGGHFGMNRTIEVIQRFYFWPTLKQDVREYIATCDICQRMKVPRHKPHGLLAPLPRPEGPWEDISMDFIVGLPPSLHMRTACDAILVVVDRFSKMVRYIPCRGDITAEGLASALIENIFSKYGAPKSIVSDRGTTFTAKYWSTLCYYLAVRRLFSTAFHPQTDGQTERMNQTLECYLRCYINYYQNDWVELLPGAEYAANQSINATTKISPFELVYRFTPTLRMNLARDEIDGENVAAKSRLQKIEESIKTSKEEWEKAQESITKYYNKKRKDVSFKEGEMVMLSSKHIRMRRASTKLADKFLGPFKIEKRIGNNAYQLQLPQKYGKLHHTFHVSLLEAWKAREGSNRPEPVEIDGAEEWEVEKILDQRTTKNGKTQYYVRWAGFSESGDSWEPLQNIANAPEKLAEFKRSRNKDT